MTEDSQRRRRRLIGMGFVLAFALSTATIIYTGLNVRAPGSASKTRASQSDPEADIAAPDALPDAAEPLIGTSRATGRPEDSPGAEDLPERGVADEASPQPAGVPPDRQ